MDFPNNVKVSDARLQSYKLNFNFITESEKLIINATSSKDNLMYVGQIAAHPLIDFQLIKQMLQEGEYKTMIINQSLLKIRIGATIVELMPKQKSQIKELKLSLQKSIKRQEQLESIIKSQQTQLNEYKNMLLDLKKTVEDMKQSPNVLQNSIQKLKQKLLANDDLIQKVQSIQRQIEDTNEIVNNHESRINRLQKVEYKVDKLDSELNKKIMDLKQTVQQSNKNNNLSINNGNLNDSINQFYNWSHVLKGKTLIIKQIENTVRTPYSDKQIFKFCLLQVGFSREMKQKQSWTIKINNQSRYLLRVGICSRNIIRDNNFNGKNIKWGQNNNGVYVMDSGGWVYSHSQKQHRNQKNGFSFNKGDVLTIQYDPVRLKLKYSKNNNTQRFEYSIVAPSQNDAYHPCVCLYQTPQQIQPHEVQLVSTDITV